MPGILNKTMLAMEYFSSRMHEFNFVLRTNLSSFYVFPILLQFLKTIPQNECYCAYGEGFGSGCGFLLSVDVVRNMIAKKQCLMDIRTTNDDVAIGIFLREKGIFLRPAPRTDLLCWQDWDNCKGYICPDTFHYRIKNLQHDRRHTEDLRICSELLKYYYGVDKNFFVECPSP